jgi:hypothetical protein
MRKKTMAYNEMAIVWTEPQVDAESGLWTAAADNLTARTKDALAWIDLCSLIEEERFAAKVTFCRDYVARYGAHRCWWFLREMVTEAPVLVNPLIQGHMDEALARDWPGEGKSGWDDDDLGDLGWGRLDYVS